MKVEREFLGLMLSMVLHNPKDKGLINVVSIVSTNIEEEKNNLLHNNMLFLLKFVLDEIKRSSIPSIVVIKDKIKSELIASNPDYLTALKFASNAYERGKVSTPELIDTLNNKLGYEKLEKFLPKLQEMIDNIDIGNINVSRETYLEYTSDLFLNIGRNVRPSDVKNNRNTIMMDSDSNDVLDSLSCALQSNESANLLKRGTQGHSIQLGYSEAYQRGQSYLYLGMQGGGKSMELLRAIKDVVVYNNDIADEDEKPVKRIAMYITCENDMSMTQARWYDLVLPESYVVSHPFEEQTPESILEAYEKHGVIGGAITPVFIYRKTKSITTNDIESMILDYQSDGYEVVMCSVDYTKRIKPIDGKVELRFQLANIVDELHAIASEHNIAMITGGQLNSESIQNIMEHLRKGKNISHLLSAKLVSESSSMMDNIAYAYLVHQVSDVHGQGYQMYASIKNRGKKSKYHETVVYVPYMNKHLTPHLEDDINSKTPSYHTNIELVDAESKGGMVNTRTDFVDVPLKKIDDLI